MDISALPYFTPLVKDYLTRFETAPIRNFFAIAPEAPHAEMRELIDRRLARSRSLSAEYRKTIARSIGTLHKSIGPVPAAVVKNIELLESPDTLAVVTGQQAGLLGGPLYTFYKAFTAVELARTFKEQFPQFSFVPVFWIETEDHDLEEITSVTVLNSEGQPETIRYTPESLRANPGEPWRKQAGPTPMEEAPLQEFFETVTSALQPTDFTASALEFFRTAYRVPQSFGNAFASLLNSYFGEDGLLMIDANSKELKSLASDLFRREIEESPRLSEQIVLRSEQLEEFYHAQVKPRALNLFYVNEEGDRLAINEKDRSIDERSFFLQGTRKYFTLSELLKEVDRNPERFSPNVVMRPLYQDSLLPTVAYVAGPGETAYFAQFQPAYEWAQVPMPLIHPRVTVTLIEERLERIFSKYNVTAEDVLSESHAKSTALLDAAIESELLPRFEQALEETDKALEALRPNIVQADPTLDGALTSLKGKVLTSIRDFQNKTLAAERKRHATTKAQLDKLLAALLPLGELQERELNLLYFLNKYGPDFFHALKKPLQPVALDFAQHHIIHLNEMGVISASSTDGRTSATPERLTASPISN